MPTSPLRLAPLLALLALAACEEPQPVARPSAFDWSNEQPSGGLVRKLSSSGAEEERMRVSRTALRHYEGPGERGSHLRATANGLELLTADGRPWCRGVLERSERRAALVCDGFAKVELSATDNQVIVTRDGALWGRLLLREGRADALESGTTRLIFTLEGATLSAKQPDGKQQGALAGWSRGNGAALLWLPLPASPGFGDDRWRAVRASAAWLASSLLDGSTQPPPAGSGAPKP